MDQGQGDDVSKTWYTEMYCDGRGCNVLLGYYVDSGPGSGNGTCVSCYENEPDTEYDEEDDD